MRTLVLVAALLTLGGRAEADPAPITLRMASVVPEGTAWARELRAFAREVEAGTHGRVRVKWFLGGIAGDELEVKARIQRGQLDGIVSGSGLCQQLAPALRVMRVPGLFQRHEEAAYVVDRLRPLLDQELREAGYANLAEAGIGPTIPFTRAPVRTLAELRRDPLWLWDVDDVGRRLLPEMGLRIVPLPIWGAGRAYDEKKHDGFLTPPTAALAFQWSTQARYFTDLRMYFVIGCMVVANRAFDELPTDAQQVVRNAAAKAAARFEDDGRTMDEQLMSGLFQKQGLERVEVSAAFRAEFFEAARLARERAAGSLVPAELMQRVLSLLADYRAEHR